MRTQVLIAFAIAFACVSAFDANEYHYNAGAKFDQVETDMTFGASGDVVKFQNDLGKAGEVHLSKDYSKGKINANAGLTHANNKYAHADVSYGDKVQSGQYGAQAAVDYIDNYTNGTAVAGYQGVVNDVNVEAGAQISADSNQNKNYVLGAKATKAINEKLTAMGAAGLNNKDAALEGALSYYLDQIDAKAGAFAGLDYNVDTKASGYGVGANINKKVYDNKIDLNAGAVLYPKNDSKVGFASASYGDQITGGSVGANANVAYDLNTKGMVQQHVDATVNKNFGNGLVADAIAQMDFDQGSATGNVAYKKNLDNTTALKAGATATYSINGKAIVNKGAAVAVDKDFENGLTAGAAATYLNDDTNANVHAKYVKLVNDVMVKAGGNVDYNVNAKNATGVFGVIANSVVQKDYNVSAFANVLTAFNNYYNGNFGVLFNDFGAVNTGSVNVATSFRGAKPTVGNIVFAFKHIFDATTNMDVEVTRFPDNTFQLGGHLNKVIDGNKTFKAYFKMDKEGNFVFA